MSKFLSFLPFFRKKSRIQRAGDFARRVGPVRGGVGLGGVLASLAIPFVIRRVRERRAERQFQPAL
jgi:hypothetical protein